MSIGGFVCVRNAIALDYCVTEAIQSLLPICDQVCISESESTDGTREMLNVWASRESKLKIIDFPWTDPRGDITWYPTWINHARTGLTTDYGIYLDADEVLEPASYDRVRLAASRGESLICRRLNYWRDAQSLIPEGYCCGAEVIRAGPQRLFFPSDYADERATEIQNTAIRAHDVVFHHYGFLRHRDAFFRKARTVSRIWVGADQFDPRLQQAEREGGNWMANLCVSEWITKLKPYTGTHPHYIHSWLRERGYWMTIEDLIKKWQHVLDAGSHIWTWTEPSNLAYLAEQASKATNAVEIGTYMGASAHTMLKANPKLHLWCVDPFAVVGTKKVTEYFLRQEIAEGRCELITNTSDIAAQMLVHMKGRLDLVFVDGGHDTPTVMKDIENMMPLLRQGGVMCGHDFDSNPYNDVALAVQKSLPSWNIPVPRVWEYVKP